MVESSSSVDFSFKLHYIKVRHREVKINEIGLCFNDCPANFGTPAIQIKQTDSDQK